MGDPKKLRKIYNTPSHPWINERITEENRLVREYGLANKREVWKGKSKLDMFRGQARSLRARLRTASEQAVKERDQLLTHLTKYGYIKEGSDLDDVLSLTLENVLSRRLQSQVYMRGLAYTMKHARQLITHGHIAIGDRKITVPSYVVKVSEESLIQYHSSSPLTMEEHPSRPKMAATSTIRSQVERPVDISTTGDKTENSTETEASGDTKVKHESEKMVKE